MQIYLLNPTGYRFLESEVRRLVYGGDLLSKEHIDAWAAEVDRLADCNGSMIEVRAMDSVSRCPEEITLDPSMFDALTIQD